MNDIAALDPYGRLTEPTTLTIQRLLPGPVERVWSYLTQSELRRQWLASGEMPLTAGASFELVWRNDELTDPPGARPAGINAENRMQSRIVAVEAPRMLCFTFGADNEVTFSLEPAGGRVLLTVIHRRLAERGMRLKVSAGWHMHLDLLVSRLTGAVPAPFWDGWDRLRDEYDRRQPA
jgi:uncharacterized protein YndB with AHSA1/START domain